MRPQPDLFGEDDAADVDRLVAGLTCLAEAYPYTLEVLIGEGSRARDRGEIKQGKTDPWAYSARREGLWFEPVATWAGWMTRPARLLGWAELDELVEADARLVEIRAWSDSLTAADAWRDRYRPHQLHPDGGAGMHPSWIDEERERPGWEQRRHAWGLAMAVCTDAAALLSAG